MSRTDDDMDELFRKAAEGYQLNDPKDDWDKIAGALSDKTSSTVARKGGSSDRGRLYLLMLLLLFSLSTCAYLTHYIIKTVSQNDNSAVVNRVSSAPPAKNSTVKQLDKCPPIKDNAPTVDNKAKEPLLKEKETPHEAGSALRKSAVSTNLRLRETKQPTGRFLRTKQKSVDDKRYSRRAKKLNEESVVKGLDRLNPSKKMKAAVSKTDNASAPEPGKPNISAKTHPLVDSIMKVSNKDQKNDSAAATLVDSSTSKARTTAGDSVKPKTAKVSSVADRGKGILVGLTIGPEWNQVKNQGMNKVGYDYGVFGGYRFNEKISLEAGFLLSKKFYYSSGQYFNLKMPGKDVVSLEGKSTIIEIPVKLKYDFLNKGKSTGFLSGGLISYLLTNETNDYILLVNGAEMNVTNHYTNASRYFASAADLSIGYEHSFGRLAQVRIEPYIQLPLKGIGVGSMQVMSTGVHFAFVRKFKKDKRK